MKRKTFAGAMVVMALSLLIYGTTAYFTAEKTAHNVITSGNIEIELLEWADQEKTIPFPKEAVEGVMPGSDVTKIVEVENTGTNAAFVRVKVDKMIELVDASGQKPDLGLMQLDFDKDYWIKQEGYYYYKEAVDAGETTKPLFASVSFDKTMDNRYQNSTAKVNVTAYATQQANNGKKALEAKGWPEVEEVEN